MGTNSEKLPISSCGGRSDEGPSRSLYLGAVPLAPSYQRGPAVYIIANLYKNITEHEHISLGGHKDCESVKEWAKRLTRGSKTDIYVSTDADVDEIRPVLKNCGDGPTFVYLNGHTEWSAEKKSYLATEYSAPTKDVPGVVKGVPFEIMREWIIGASPGPMDLLLVTDICFCPNFLRLPYLARKVDGVWVWIKTEYYTEESSSYWEDKNILHFAATDEDGEAYEWESIGGIHTREFCNVKPNVSLRSRLDDMQCSIDRIVSEFADGATQHAPLYSSYEADFEDKHIFKSIIHTEWPVNWNS
ncbi:hypothetical protein RhiJN_09233 [Ceratobasidium sp. AG-Ba]|nr:hypothetical protein RhiJN_09233 [Ceratobasidium sp. AG-Ba]